MPTKLTQGFMNVRQWNASKASDSDGINSSNVAKRKTFVMLQTSQGTALKLSSEERSCKDFLISLISLVFVYREHGALSPFGKILNH